MCTIAECRELLEQTNTIRDAVRAEVRELRQAARTHSAWVVLQNSEQEIAWREIAALELFDRVADDLATEPESENYGTFVRHVLECARTAVNNHALANGGELILGAVF